MADKIKKFFQKKKADAKFKMAGPGHKLSESAMSNQSSSSSQNSFQMPKRLGLTEESKVAAEAALARLSQKRENPSFNTSLAAIQAQVRRELENENATCSNMTERSDSVEREVKEPDNDVPGNFAAAGVYFKCPIISNDVLPREEWKRNIKTFLYEQLEDERGLTACLIIHSCNTNKEKIDTCVETLCKYLENILAHPDEDKYMKIRMSNRVFTEKVQPLEGTMELLQAAGFLQQSLPNAEGVMEDYLVFHRDNVPSLDTLNTLIDALRTASPIQLELERNLQVMLPSQAAAKMALPSSFYALSAAELKREAQLRAEVIEKSQMLRTKAMREKDEIREMRKYKFAIIRVRFPDGILLQGTFSVYERFIDIHEFVRENLENDLPFILNTPTSHKLILDEDANKTLIDLRLVPASVLTFAWHNSVIDEISNSPNKDVYLKPEVMILVQEI